MSSPHGTPEPSRPSSTQIAATIALLGDDRGPVQAAARERLLRWGDDQADPNQVREHLRAAAEAEHLLTRVRSRALLREFEVSDCLRTFAALRLGRGGRTFAPALLEGAVLLSQMVRTFVPEAFELASRLRSIAGSLRKEFAGRSLPVCARRLAERLHGEIGLQGEPVVGDATVPAKGAPAQGHASALDLDHVLIDRVLEQRTGVPVSLSLIYLLVARWAGLSAAGVAMPDHFLVRLHGVRPVLLDPYHGGRSVTKTDCARYLRANGYDQVREHLRDLTDREVLIQYLRSLQLAAAYRAVPEARRTLGRALAFLETN
ncbi:MAG: transglutaminase family protein [Planctomycetes bacterium]|nr:transglutaminase family protein [Planctomycetota bacterium]